MAVGEANNNLDQVRAIASTIKDRINESGTSLNDPNWALHTSYGKNGKSGGSVVGNYNVVNGKGKGGEAYNDVMALSPDYIANISTNAGLKALLYTFSNAGWSGPDYSNPNGLADTGWYYWIKTVDLFSRGSSYNSATMVKTIPNLNGTTFFRPK